MLVVEGVVAGLSVFLIRAINVTFDRASTVFLLIC